MRNLNIVLSLIFLMACDVKSSTEEQTIMDMDKVKQWNEVENHVDIQHKFYEKYPVSHNGKELNPTLVIRCIPEKTVFQYNSGNLEFEEKRDQIFTFNVKGQDIEKAYDLTEDGLIGLYKAEWPHKVVFDQDKNDEVISLLKQAISLKVSGNVFHMDDVSQVPCLK